MKMFMATIASLFLVMASANASERQFRIDHNKSVKHGYAIAWGIPGQLIDFEKLDQSSDEEIVNFINTADVSNYLVDIETNSILKVVTSEDVDYNLGGYHIGNHFGLNVDYLAVGGLCNSCDAAIIIQEGKWANGILSLEIMERKKETRIIKSFDDFAVEALLKSELRKKIKGKKALELFDKAASTMTSIETGIYDKGVEVNKISLNFSIPKSDDPGLDVEALVKLSLVNSKLEITVLSVRQKIE